MQSFSHWLPASVLLRIMSFKPYDGIIEIPEPPASSSGPRLSYLGYRTEAGTHFEEKYIFTYVDIELRKNI